MLQLKQTETLFHSEQLFYEDLFKITVFNFVTQF